MRVAAGRHRIRQRTRIEEENASQLQLGEEFANATCLSVSEAKIILEAVLAQRQKELGDEIVMTDVMRKTKDYLNIFARFKTQESVHAAERVLRGDPDLHSFETAQLGTLCCEEAEEARTLVPSLADKKSDEALQTLLDELSNLRRREMDCFNKGKQKKRKRIDNIQKISSKQARIENDFETWENKKFDSQLRNKKIQKPLYDSEEEDELTVSQEPVIKKKILYGKYGNEKRELKKNPKISNKHKIDYKNLNVSDSPDIKTDRAAYKIKKMKETNFFQEIDHLENATIGDCIEVELSDDTDKKRDKSDSSDIVIISSQEKQDSIDVISDDPLTSSFVNINVPIIKKKQSNSIDYSIQNNSILVENITNDYSVNLSKEEINYEYEKKQDILENKTFFNNFKNHILEKLTGRKHVPIIGLESEYTKLREMLYQTVNLGESNSCLIVGPKSSGKSNILDTAIISLNEFSSQFFVVRLNGIIQTDDKLALKEIARQLNVKMNLDDQENITSNFSDNLFKILTILSHPKELDLVNDDKSSGEFDTYYDPSSSNNITSVSVIFVLDNFDLFTQHYRQTLLYNLFDISQTRKAPIAVIGLTCALDSVESLEKRVKSRFSHRIIQIRYPDNLELFIKICRAGLTIDCELLSELPLKEKELQFSKNWNRHIDDLFEEGNLIYQLVKGIFMISKDVREFYSHCIVPIISLSSSSPDLQENLFLFRDFFHSSSKTELLNGISLLQLSLLICAARINARDINTLNFNMVYKEYYYLVTKSASSSTYSVIKNASIKLWEKDILLDAWEKLCDLNFFQPSGNFPQKYSGGLDRDCKMYYVEITLIDLISYINKVKTIPTILKRWLKDVI
ncbi:hypothetical protein PCANB_000592 [Pneumocystis canis]|nr:hypothetical protein PCANB_000592 [Pneumocystis canis]